MHAWLPASDVTSSHGIHSVSAPPIRGQHTLTLPHSRTLTLSHSHTLTLSHSHMRGQRVPAAAPNMLTFGDQIEDVDFWMDQGAAAFVLQDPVCWAKPDTGSWETIRIRNLGFRFLTLIFRVFGSRWRRGRRSPPDSVRHRWEQRIGCGTRQRGGGQ